MSTLLRRHRRGGRSDAGTTLAELNVTMLITGVIVAATVTLLIGFQRANAANISRQDQIDGGRTAVEAMSATLRSAVKPVQLPGCMLAVCPDDAFLQASDFTVKFFANLDNAGNTVGPSRVTYEVMMSGPTTGQLIEKIQRPTSNLPGPSGYVYCDAEAPTATALCKADLSTRPLAFGVLAESGKPLLTYYDKDGAVMTPSIGGTLTVAEMARLLSVELQVRVQSANGTTADPTEFIQRITLPNAQSLIRQEATP